MTSDTSGRRGAFLFALVRPLALLSLFIVLPALSACTTDEGTNALVDPSTFEREVMDPTLQGLDIIPPNPDKPDPTRRAPLVLPKSTTALPPPVSSTANAQLPVDSVDPKISTAGLSQADAQFKEAKASYDRSKGLYEKGIISKSDWDKAVSAYEVAQAQKQSAYFNVQSANATVREAKDNLGRTQIFSPADGTVSLLNVELGERVLGTKEMAGTELLRVANLANMEVEVDVNENDIVKISVGDSAKVQVDAWLKKEFRGVVTSISNSASATTSADQVTNFKVKVHIL